MTHRERLQDELLSAYDRRYPPRSAPRSARWAPALAAAVLVIGTLIGSRAPAEYAAQLGQRIEVRVAAGDGLPHGAELERLVTEGLAVESAGQGERRLEVSLRRTANGPAVLRVDLWGAPIAGIVERLRARTPQLKDADIAVQALTGKVRTSVAGLLGHRFLKLSDAASIEAARRELQAELDQHQGGEAKVEVLEGPEGRRVRVKVEERQVR